MNKISELERLKKGIKAGTIKLVKPPLQKVKNRKIAIIKPLDFCGDPIDDLEYLTEFSKVINWCLYIENLEQKFNSEKLDYFHFRNNKVYDFSIKTKNLILVIT